MQSIATSSTKLLRQEISRKPETPISRCRPPLPPAAGRNTPLYATRLRLPLAATEKQPTAFPRKLPPRRGGRPPPPHAAPRAARHAKTGARFAKSRKRRTKKFSARNLAPSFCGPTPVGKELRAPSSSSPRRGWRWLARPYGSQLLYFPPNTRAPNPRNFSAQRPLSARLGKSCLNNSHYSNVFPS